MSEVEDLIAKGRRLSDIECSLQGQNKKEAPKDNEATRLE